jgi:hypothetical protein
MGTCLTFKEDSVSDPASVIEARQRMPAGRWLRAGHVRALFADGDLRYVTAGDVEIVRRIYLAVRDLNWNTLPGRTTDVDVVDRGDSFRIGYRCRHTVGGIDFAWTAAIDGDRHGRITFGMDGEAFAAFAYAKIGLCVHHPIDGFAGHSFTGTAEHGAVTGALPDTIGPQIHLADGTDLPLFDPVRELSISHAAGGTVRFGFEGDLWEMEDQRNWTDASYKSASTPASLGYHHEIALGGRIRQAVTVTSEGFTPSANATGTAPAVPVVTVSGPSERRMPPVGLGLAIGELPLDPAAVGALRLLAPRHLRLDLHLREAHWRAALADGVRAAGALESDLELAVFLADEPGTARDLADLAGLLTGLDGASVRRVLVFHEDEEATSWKSIERARSALGDATGGALFAGGTNIYFNELNRHRIPPGPADGLAWSITPQIHAFDELSLMENLSAQPETVRTARVFAGSAALFAGPITLRPRFNAVAVTEEVDDAMPGSVDPRQPSLFAAAWTLGSVAALAPCGLGAMTYYETVGARGVLEGPAGSRYPGEFRSVANRVYPLFHVLADAAELAGGVLRPVGVTDPQATAAVAVQDPADAGVTCLLVANLTDRERAVRIEDLPSGRTTLRVLDETTVAAATEDPVSFRNRRDALPRNGPGLSLELLPHATARIEVRTR